MVQRPALEHKTIPGTNLLAMAIELAEALIWPQPNTLLKKTWT